MGRGIGKVRIIGQDQHVARLDDIYLLHIENILYLKKLFYTIRDPYCLFT